MACRVKDPDNGYVSGLWPASFWPGKTIFFCCLHSIKLILLFLNLPTFLALLNFLQIGYKNREPGPVYKGQAHSTTKLRQSFLISALSPFLPHRFVMKSVSGGGLTMAALMLLLLLLPTSEAVLSCSDVITDLTPCLSYLTSGSGKPSASCCSGTSKLAAAASTSADKKAACNCLKSTAKQINANSAAAQALPGDCGISLPFTVSPNTDCTKLV